MEKEKTFIRCSLSERDLLENVAEEAAEISQAAIKLIRSKGWSNNFTPVCSLDAQADLDEEIQDLLVVLLVMGYDLQALVDDVPKNLKIKRWAERLGYSGSPF